MALAQETPLLLLDEPTTFLDITHQIEVLDLCAELHEEQGRTLVAVLHDLNHACRYATHLIAMADGAIVAEGDPQHIVTADLVAARLRPPLPRHRRPRDRHAAGRPGSTPPRRHSKLIQIHPRIWISFQILGSAWMNLDGPSHHTSAGLGADPPRGRRRRAAP